ncbi:MAG: linear amide C-N hydrolase [Spirochaetales bacterium]|nr:linear amide C-N hydrolase [Spirochaetales bacterium]
MTGFVLIVIKSKLKTLLSLSKIDDHPLYIMTYDGGYHFDDYLKIGSKNPQEFKEFLFNKLLFSNQSNIINNCKFACTSFSAINEKNQYIFGRNYDYYGRYASLVLFTNPPKGYASVSMVNIDWVRNFNIFGKGNNHPITSWEKRIALLAAPYLPFDGMNEYGLVVSVNSVNKSKASIDPNKITIGYTQAIRLMLDHARNIDEAISLLHQYNIDFVTTNPQPIHFHIADASGESVIVEFINGEIVLVKSDTPWQVATNFILEGNNKPELSCNRYRLINGKLKEKSGKISDKRAMDLLKQVSNYASTNWSVLYNLNSGQIQIVMGMKYYHIEEIKLMMKTGIITNIQP